MNVKNRVISVMLSAIMLFCMTTVYAHNFKDVKESDWFSESVEYVSSKGLLMGVSDDEFDPMSTMTRGMFVTILGRIADIDLSDYTKEEFPDVKAGTWYAPYVTWAYQKGIASGFEDGKFYPNNEINREQIATLLFKFSSTYNMTLAKNSNALESYTDESSVSSWAAESVKALRESAVFSGDVYGNFNPQNNATRAEISNVIMRFDRVRNGEVLEVIKPSKTPIATLPPVTQSKAEQILANMSLKEKVYQMFVVSPEALTGVTTVTQAGTMTKDAIERQPVGGIMYKADNLLNADQTKSMIEKTKAYSPNVVPFISVDEEGGNVARVANKLGTTKFRPMYEYRDDGAETAFTVGRTIANDIKQFGFNQDYAPVADVWSNPENTVIGTRAFSSDANVVASMVAAEVKGLQENGVISTLKHFPGHGDTSEDSHSSKAYTYKTLEQLRECEFIPFKAGIDAGAEFVMCAHITAPEVDPGVPATMSYKFITEILKGELGFKGIVITDALEMNAISQYYTSADAAVNCVKAGVDMLLCPDTLSEAVNAVIDAVNNGTISVERINESVLKILQVKEKYGVMQ